MSDTLLKLTGDIENIVFKNKSNGYKVVELFSDSSLVICTGIMPDVNVGDTITFFGHFVNHPSYGEQFSVETYEKSLPETIEGILRFLSSGTIKGIGISSAKKLIKEFKDNTLKVLENEPERISKIKGFSKEKAESISKQIKEIKYFSKLIEYLKPYGVEIESITKIFKKFGSNSIDIINDNPYILCTDELNVLFETADEIAENINIPKDASYRIRAGIMYVIEHNKNNGHTCLPKDKLTKVSSSLLMQATEIIESNINNMTDDCSLYLETFNNKEFIFSKDMYDAETFISREIHYLLDYKAFQIFDVDEEIKRIEKSENIEYADLQKEAINNALKKGVLILTGGPGTGKTTTLNAIINILKHNGQKVELAAPTGRAAQRMSELTHCEAKTIHRLLESRFLDLKGHSVFNKNEHNKIECDALVIDEASMIDVILFSSLIKAMPLGCRLIIVGDSNQLPSVGPGNILGDLISSNLIPCVKLNEIFRQSLKSTIVTNAHRIVNGDMPLLDNKGTDFFFIKAKNNEEILDNILSLYTKRLPQTYGYDSINDIQIITPTRKTNLGTLELNKSIQKIINDDKNKNHHISNRYTNLIINDKVIQTKNDYDVEWVNTKTGECGEGVFNGDIGILKNIDKISGIAEIEFDDKLAIYRGEQIENVELCYACTIHKSQGNEFEAVIIPVFHTAPQLLYRNLLYTGVTRAKKLLVLVGYESVIEKMVKNNTKQGRYTGLKEFLLS